MADGVETFDWTRNMNRVGEGFKNNPFFNEPNLVPAFNIGEGHPAEVDQKMQMGATETPTPTDAWNQRR